MIRYAGEQDLSRIAELLVFGKRTAYRDIFQDDVGSFQGLQVLDVIEKYRQNPDLLKNTLVYDDGIVKGMIGRQDFGKDEIELCDFYVEPVFQGMGIGQELLNFFLREAKAVRKKRVFLWVLEENASARTFYERFGFAPDGQKKPVEGTQVMELRYGKDL